MAINLTGNDNHGSIKDQLNEAKQNVNAATAQTTGNGNPLSQQGANDQTGGFDSNYIDPAVHNRVPTGYFGGAQSFEFGNARGILGRGVEVISDGLTKLEKSITEAIKTYITTSKLDIKVIPLDHNNHRDLPVDVLLVVTRRPVENIATCYAIAAAQSDEILGTVPTDVDGIKYSVNIYPSQLFNTKGIEKFFLAKAREHFPDATKCLYSGGSVLATDRIDFNDSTSVLRVLLNALAADFTEEDLEASRRTGKLKDLNMAAHVRSQDLICDRKILNTTTLDEHGCPVRADFCFTIDAEKVNDKQRAAWGGSSLVRDVINLTGYIDLVLVSPNQSSNNLYGGSNPWDVNAYQITENNPNAKQMYASNIVFTSVNSSEYQSLGYILWGIACGVIASWDDWWWVTQGLNPLNVSNSTNIHSIAGLGYEISALQKEEHFQPLPVDSKDFNLDTYKKIIRTYFTPNFLFSLEVGEAAAGQWKYDTLIRAAYEDDTVVNNPDSANAQILAHANMLCNGRFMDIYKRLGGTGRCVSTLRKRNIIMGRYHNPVTGTVRSLQDFDRRLLLNLVNGSEDKMAAVREFVRCQVDENMTPQQRVAIQSGIIRSIAPSAEIERYGVRLDFNDLFIQALIMALGEGTGMTLVNNNSVSEPSQMYYAYHLNNSMMNNLGRSLMIQQAPRNQVGGNFFGFGGYSSM